jgi:hypothetical protein
MNPQKAIEIVDRIIGDPELYGFHDDELEALKLMSNRAKYPNHADKCDIYAGYQICSCGAILRRTT